MTSSRAPFIRREYLLTILLVVLVSAGLLGLAAATGWQEAWDSIRAVTMAQIAVLLGLSMCNYVLRGLRWHLFSQALEIPISALVNLRLYLAGLAMIATPGRIGELVRLRWIGRESGAPLERTAPLVILDRASDLVAIGCLLAICILAGAGITGGIPAVIFALGAAFLVTRPKLMQKALTCAWRLIGHWPRLFVKARKAALALTPFSQPGTAIPAILLGGLGWFAEGYSFYLLLGWMGADVGIWTAVAIFVLSMLTGGATGMPGGLGGAEVAMIGLLGLQGVPLEIATPATALIRATTLWFAIAVGFVVFPLAETSSRKASDAVEK